MYLDEIRERVDSYSAIIGIPESRRPVFGAARGAEGLRVEAEGAEIVVSMDERGTSSELFRSTSRDEILYWIFVHASFDLAQRYVAPLDVSAKERRNIRFARQLELLGALDVSWSERFESEIRDILINETGDLPGVGERLREIKSLRTDHG